MSWFGRARGPLRSGPPDEPDEPRAGDASEPTTDTVGNPIVQRALRESGARHAAPDTGPTRAEIRMLESVAAGRIAWMVSGASGFWRIDGAFATGPKAMMLDWLRDEGYLGFAPRVRVTELAVLTDSGRALVDGTA